MDKNTTQTNLTLNEATTVNGPAGYEEELKDYSKEQDELINNDPLTHPEPSPAKGSNS